VVIATVVPYPRRDDPCSAKEEATRDEPETAPEVVARRGLLVILALASLVPLVGAPNVGLGSGERSVAWDEIDVTVELREDSFVPHYRARPDRVPGWSFSHWLPRDSPGANRSGRQYPCG
jgi:hypothetical protein